MERSGKTGPLLIAVFAAGVILLDFPILFLFTRPVSVAGIPLLYAYVFVVWTALIGLMAYAIERPRE
jgi:hypothetical protein